MFQPHKSMVPIDLVFFFCSEFRRRPPSMLLSDSPLKK
jgi:hypothetical protein